jgi:hypothetical protein
LPGGFGFLFWPGGTAGCVAGGAVTGGGTGVVATDDGGAAGAVVLVLRWRRVPDDAADPLTARPNSSTRRALGQRP